ncbi:MAG: hypothetical protein CMI26_09150 [Opitutae bacterium]|nr:hypothetical protein [Opitutae bacterium]
MTPKSEDSMSEKVQPNLASLLDANLGPAWSSNNLPSSSPSKKRSTEQTTHSERKSGRAPSVGRSREHSKSEREKGRQTRKDKSAKPQYPRALRTEKPFHKISFFPSPETFNAIAANLRETGRTFELFDLASTILAKPERFVVRASIPKEAIDQEKTLCVSKLDGLVFDSPEAVIDHLIIKGLGNIYDSEEIETEPPSGNFPAINRCGITGDWLAPPNYHRYAEMIREHHATKLADITFDKFEKKIETIREPEAATVWIEEMRKTRKYKLTKPRANDPENFDSLEALRKHLAFHKSAAFVQTCTNTEFHGRLLQSLSTGTLRDDIEITLEQQRRFPLDTALALLGRFRAAKFHHFKRGKKGISYISPVKRRRRVAGESFSPSIEALISFLEKHPLTEKGSLAEKHLGISAEKKDELKNSDAIRTLAQDLHWLVTEGYSTEYSDGRVEIRSPIVTSEAKIKKKVVDKDEEKESTNSKVEEQPADSEKT